MAGQSRKWMILVATIWIQAFTGTNFDFSDYSSDLKSVLGISQVQLNYLAVASDLGKLFGWSSGLALIYFPLSLVLLFAAFMGFVGYGLQWLLIKGVISLPYFLVFLLCLLAGCSICWFNTVCFVLCVRNFTINRPLAISLTVSFNGVSAAFYTLAAYAIDPKSDSIYLALNAIIPLAVSILALVPILRQPSLEPLSPRANHHDSLIFLILNFVAVITGVYLLLFGSTSPNKTSTATLFLGGALFLLIFPLLVPGMVYARDWFKRTIHSSFQGSSFLLVDIDDLELHKELILASDQASNNSSRHGPLIGLNQALLMSNDNGNGNGSADSKKSSVLPSSGSECCCETIITGKDQLVVLGEEHPPRMLVRRVDFWLYFLAYFCGGTIGLVYSNNLGQIVQSYGEAAETSTIITLYSSFSFFGRLLSAAPDYIREKFYFARTGWLTIALVPTPIAFFLLATSGSIMALRAGTAMIGLSSGFIFAAAVSITSELFGPNSVGVNHNILITNIPIGSLVYGLMAALVYDANAMGMVRSETSESVSCIGRSCYFLTFVWWGCISVVGLVSSVLLFLRTRHAYDNFERNRTSTQTLE